ncbi:MAG: hypothetical protein ACRC9L_03180 [Brevinema sp.]
MIHDMKDQVQIYIDTQKSEAASKAKAILLCKQSGLITSELTDEEWHVLMRVLESSAPMRKGKKKK